MKKRRKKSSNRICQDMASRTSAHWNIQSIRPRPRLSGRAWFTRGFPSVNVGQLFRRWNEKSKVFSKIKKQRLENIWQPSGEIDLLFIKGCAWRRATEWWSCYFLLQSFLLSSKERAAWLAELFFLSFLFIYFFNSTKSVNGHPWNVTDCRQNNASQSWPY